MRKPSPNTHVRVLLFFLLCRRICGRCIGDDLQQGVFFGDNDAVICVVTVVLLTLTTLASLVLAFMMVLFLAAITAGKQKQGEKRRTNRNNKRFLFHRVQRYLTNTAECRFCSSSERLSRFCLKKILYRSRGRFHSLAETQLRHGVFDGRRGTPAAPVRHTLFPGRNSLTETQSHGDFFEEISTRRRSLCLTSSREDAKFFNG